MNLQDISELTRFYNGARALFGMGVKGSAPTWPRFAMKTTSKTRTETYAAIGDFPEFEEWIGARTYKNLKAYGFSITNKKFQAAVKISADDVDDDAFGLFDKKMVALGRGGMMFPDKLAFELLLNGFTEPCYDGQNLIDGDHPMGDTTFSNLLTNATAPDTSVSPQQPWFLVDASREEAMPLIVQFRRELRMRAIVGLEDQHVFDTDEFSFGGDLRMNVGFWLWQTIFGCTCALTQKNFEAAYAQMMKVKSDAGRPLDIKPTLLLCGPDNRAASNEVVQVERLASGASNPNWKDVDVLVSSRIQT